MKQTPLVVCRALCRHAGHTHQDGSPEELACLALRLLFLESAFDQAEAEVLARIARDKIRHTAN